MMPSRPDATLTTPSQRELDWLLAQGVSVMSMVRPCPMMIAKGTIAADGLFEHADEGDRWLAFQEAEDIVFWQPRLCATTSWCGRAFAVGEDVIDDPATYAFDCALNIFASPLDWLRAGRDGIVVLDWPRAFDQRRDAPRIAIAESVLPLYRRHMKPCMPELFVLPDVWRRAA